MHVRLITLALVLSGCSNPLTPGLLEREDKYLVDVVVRFSSSLFGDRNAAVRHLEPYDEGYLWLIDSVERVPSQWSSSQNVNRGASNTVVAVHGPLIVHPDIPVTLMQQVLLPTFLCVELATFDDHTCRMATIAKAASSNCVPLPPEYEHTEFEEVKENLPKDFVYPGQIEIVVDSLLGDAVPLSSIRGHFLTRLECPE
jgi:hypothetical protein